MAAQENHAEVVKLLLDHGADQHIATPVSYGCKMKAKTNNFAVYRHC